MNKITTSLASGAALLALATTASAGPMSIASSNVVAPSQPQVELVHYYHRHYGWHRGWHYGWYRTRHHYGWHHHRYYRYGWHHPRYYRYGWNPVAAAAGTAVGLATLPFAAATGAWPYYPYGYYAPYYYY